MSRTGKRTHPRRNGPILSCLKSSATSPFLNCILKLLLTNTQGAVTTSGYPFVTHLRWRDSVGVKGMAFGRIFLRLFVYKFPCRPDESFSSASEDERYLSRGI